MDRRRLLGISLLLCTSALLLSAPAACYNLQSRQAMAPPPKEIPSLAPFVDPLPIPRTIRLDEQTTIPMGAFKTTHQYHRDLLPTAVYAYGQSLDDAQVPGPTLLALRGTPVTVQWTNNITGFRHLLPVDFSVGAPRLYNGGVPMSPHLHGMTTESTSDGHPSAWWSAFGEVGPAYAKTAFDYPNSQPGSTMWYHDHTVGMTRLNSKVGLAGLYILRDEAKEQQLGLPQGEFDVPLVLKDLSFVETGQLEFPDAALNLGEHMSWRPENFGRFPVVNGKVAPYMNVSATAYRFRLLNAATSRFFNLTFVLAQFTPVNSTTNSTNSTAQQIPGPVGGLVPSGTKLTMVQVASDSGFLPSPVPLTSLVIAPGQRVELIVDFSAVPAGMSVVLNNTAATPYPSGEDEILVHEMVLFQLTSNGTGTGIATATGTGTGVASKQGLTPAVPFVLPAVLEPLPAMDITTAVNYPLGRNVSLTELSDDMDDVLVGLLEGKGWMAPATITPRMGTSEIWNYINLTPDAHPIHFHFVHQRVIDRRPLNVTAVEANLCNLDAGECFTGPAVGPEVNENGYLDTVIAAPEMLTRVLVNFNFSDGELSFDPTSGPGYVIHCHILDHEDNDMMRPVVMLAANSSSSSSSTPPAKLGAQASTMVSSVHSGLLLVGLFFLAL